MQRCRRSRSARRRRAYRRRADPESRVGRAELELLVVPKHDRLHRSGVIATRAAVHPATQARLAAKRYRFPALATRPRPIPSGLISGSNRIYRSAPRRGDEIAEALAGILCRGGGSVLITSSRRTHAAGLALLREQLGGFSTASLDGSGENLYFAYLGLADTVLVAGDYVAMVSEAAGTGKPVPILNLDGGNAKLARFHVAMRAAGITRPFSGRIEGWSDPVPDDTKRVGAARHLFALGRRKRA